MADGGLGLWDAVDVNTGDVNTGDVNTGDVNTGGCFADGIGKFIEDWCTPDVATASQEAVSPMLCRAWAWFIAVVVFLIVLAAIVFVVVIFALPCNKDLKTTAKGFAVLDMVVVHMNSTAWEVTSRIDLALALKNPNSKVVAPLCSFTLRELLMTVRYRQTSIAVSSPVPLQSVLKCHQMFEVPSILLTGNHSQVSDEAGLALQAELLRNNNVTFELEIYLTFLLHVNTTVVNHQICEVIAKTPRQASRQVGDRGFSSASCASGN